MSCFRETFHDFDYKSFGILLSCLCETLHEFDDKGSVTLLICLIETLKEFDEGFFSLILYQSDLQTFVHNALII